MRAPLLALGLGRFLPPSAFLLPVLQILLLVAVLALHLRTTRRAADAGEQLTNIALRARDDGLTRDVSLAVLPIQAAAYRDSARRAERATWIVAGAVLLASGLLLAALIFARDSRARADQLEALDRLKRDFVANVSHDLKTPLASMQSATDVLLDELPGPLTERQRRLLTMTRDNGGRLSAMVAKLLELSRLESRIAPVHVPVDLRQVVRAAVARCHPTRQLIGRGDVESAEKTVQVDVPEIPAIVRGDGDDLDRLLDNLLENALKFSPPDGVVRVTLSVVADGFEVTVADHGPGIADADKARVFERFHQTPAGRAVASRGVGLGLAICKHVVAEAGGRIWVTDNAPQGVIMHVTLPRAQMRARPPQPASYRDSRTRARPESHHSV